MKFIQRLTFLAVSTGILLAPTANAIDQGFADQTPWVVHIDVVTRTGLHGTCTGSQINSTTVITARHCLTQPGAIAKVAGHVIESGSVHAHGDAAAAKLATPNPLPSYAKVSKTKAAMHTPAMIYGYGHQGDMLKRATVTLGPAAPDVDGATGFTLISKTGKATPGDSGGPVIVNERIVGVISGANKQGNVVAASISSL